MFRRLNLDNNCVPLTPSDPVDDIAQKFNCKLMQFYEAMTPNSGVSLILSYNLSRQQPVILDYTLWQENKYKPWADYISSVLPSRHTTSFNSSWSIPTAYTNPDYIVMKSATRVPPSLGKYNGDDGIIHTTPMSGTPGTPPAELNTAQQSLALWQTNKAILETFNNPVTTNFEQVVAQHLINYPQGNTDYILTRLFQEMRDRTKTLVEEGQRQRQQRPY